MANHEINTEVIGNGFNAGDVVKKLQDSGIYSFKDLLMQRKENLIGIQGLSEAKVDQICEAAEKEEFPHVNLTLKGAWPGLFIDKYGAYWEVPVTLAADLASVISDSGASYHLCLQHISGLAKQVEGKESSEVPANLLPGLYLKSALSLKKNIDFWSSEAKKLKFVQPYDLFLSGPHISGTALIGVVATALVGDNSQRLPLDHQPKDYKRFDLYASGGSSAVLADLFAPMSFTAQYVWKLPKAGF